MTHYVSPYLLQPLKSLEDRLAEAEEDLERAKARGDARRISILARLCVAIEDAINARMGA